MKNCYTEDVFKPSSGRIGKQEMFVGIILPMKTLMIVIRFRMVLLHSWSCLSFFYQLPPFSLGAVFSLVFIITLRFSLQILTSVVETGQDYPGNRIKTGFLETYLRPCQTSMVELFCKNRLRLKAKSCLIFSQKISTIDI